MGYNPTYKQKPDETQNFFRFRQEPPHPDN